MDTENSATASELVDRLVGLAKRVAELEIENRDLKKENENLRTTEAFWREQCDRLMLL